MWQKGRRHSGGGRGELELMGRKAKEGFERHAEHLLLWPWKEWGHDATRVGWETHEAGNEWARPRAPRLPLESGAGLEAHFWVGQS